MCFHGDPADSNSIFFVPSVTLTLTLLLRALFLKVSSIHSTGHGNQCMGKDWIQQQSHSLRCATCSNMVSLESGNQAEALQLTEAHLQRYLFILSCLYHLRAGPALARTTLQLPWQQKELAEGSKSSPTLQTICCTEGSCASIVVAGDTVALCSVTHFG